MSGSSRSWSEATTSHGGAPPTSTAYPSTMSDRLRIVRASSTVEPSTGTTTGSVGGSIRSTGSVTGAGWVTGAGSGTERARVPEPAPGHGSGTAVRSVSVAGAGRLGGSDLRHHPGLDQLLGRWLPRCRVPGHRGAGHWGAGLRGGLLPGQEAVAAQAELGAGRVLLPAGLTGGCGHRGRTSPGVTLHRTLLHEIGDVTSCRWRGRTVPGGCHHSEEASAAGVIRRRTHGQTCLSTSTALR